MQIRLIATAAEHRAVLRQRHEVFVREMGYGTRHADPHDPLDDEGFILGAFDGDRLVGSARLNYGTHRPDCGFGEYAALRDLSRFGHYCPDRLFMVTRTIIEPTYRNGTLMGRFALAFYRHMREYRPECAFCLIDCVPAMKPLFARLGARQTGPAFEHPTAGAAVPMAYVLYDKKHFERVRSPVAAECPWHDAEVVDWFESTFASELEHTGLRPWAKLTSDFAEKQPTSCFRAAPLSDRARARVRREEP